MSHTPQIEKRQCAQRSDIRAGYSILHRRPAKPHTLPLPHSWTYKHKEACVHSSMQVHDCIHVYVYVCVHVVFTWATCVFDVSKLLKPIFIVVPSIQRKFLRFHKLHSRYEEQRCCQHASSLETDTCASLEFCTATLAAKSLSFMSFLQVLINLAKWHATNLKCN